MKRIYGVIIILSILLVGVLYLNNSNDYLCSNIITSNNYMLKMPNNILTDELLESDVWWENVQKDYQEYLGEDYQDKVKRNGIASKNADKIRDLFDKTVDDEVIFPPYIGGLYINDNNDLVIQIVKNNIPTDLSNDYLKYLKVLSVDKNAIIEYVNYSDQELKDLNDSIINALTSKYSFEEIGIAKLYIDTINNSVVVELLDYNEVNINKFKHLISNSKAIKIKQGDKIVSSLKAGGKIGGCSVGYRARKKSSGKGFVTAGHCYCNGTNISGYGVVQNRQLTGKVDAAWINSAGTSLTIYNTLHKWNVSGTQPLPSPASITTTVSTPTVGQYIGRVGQTTGHRLGQITSVNLSFHLVEGDDCLHLCPTMTNQISTTVYQDYGDSGGIVYLSADRSTLGIGTFKDTSNNHMIFNSAKNINSAFGISRY